MTEEGGEKVMSKVVELVLFLLAIAVVLLLYWMIKRGALEKAYDAFFAVLRGGG